MRVVNIYVVVGLLLLCPFQQVYAGILMIVHPSNTATFDQNDIAKIWLGRSNKFSSGKPAIPISLQESNPSSSHFNRSVLGKTGSQLKSYWSKLVFTGKGTPPAEVKNDAEMVALVSANPSMIGYVNEGKATDQVKVVGKF